MIKRFDCVVCGSCVVDMLCRPVDLDKPIGRGVLHDTEPLMLTGGGIVSNSGITMARLGMKIAAFSFVGNDAWGPVLRDLYEKEGVVTDHVMTHPERPTSTTVVAIDPGGERSFFHCVGAPKRLGPSDFYDNLDLFASSHMMLLGYYSLLPTLEDDLPEIFARVRETGCKTAMDAAGAGGAMQPLDRILPHLDLYVPSLTEACHQTGVSEEDDPRIIIDRYRACGAPGILGVKLGMRGVLLSPKAGEYVQIDVAQPPGEVIDTTGAGDSFYAGLLSGLVRGFSLEQAGKLGAAAGACCVTSLGGCTGGRDFQATAAIAGIA